MNYYSLNIPVKAHVYKFLDNHLSTPYKLTESDWIGPTVLQMLRRPSDNRKSSLLVDRLSHSWQVKISSDMLHNRCAYELGARNIMSINTFVDAQMKLMLSEEVKKFYLLGQEKKTTILNFMKYYGIGESEMSFDAWKKSVQRIEYRKIK